MLQLQWKELIIVQLQPHAIMNFIIFQGYMVLEKKYDDATWKRMNWTYLKYCVPLLDSNLFRPSTLLYILWDIWRKNMSNHCNLQLERQLTFWDLLSYRLHCILLSLFFLIDHCRLLLSYWSQQNRYHQNAKLSRLQLCQEIRNFPMQIALCFPM